MVTRDNASATVPNRSDTMMSAHFQSLILELVEKVLATIEYPSS